MEILFKNSFKKTEEWVKKTNKYSLFKAPLARVLSVICVVLLVWDVYQLAVWRKFDLLFWFVPIFVFVWRWIVYARMNKITLKRNLELFGENPEVISEVTNELIRQYHQNGTEYKIHYDTIKKVVFTKNYILLWSKANILYSFKKDGFSVGNQTEFLMFLQSKGIKVG